MAREKKTARLSCVPQYTVAAPAAASGNSSPSSESGNSSSPARRRHRIEHERPEERNEEEQVVEEKDDSPAVNLEFDEDATADSPPRLEPWEQAEREAEEEEYEAEQAMDAVREAEGLSDDYVAMIYEHRAVEESLTAKKKKPEEEETFSDSDDE